MKTYIDSVFKREKKPISLEKLYQKVEELLSLEQEGYSLTIDDKLAIDKALREGLDSYHYYQSPNNNFTLLRKTTYRLGRFHGNRLGEGFVTTNISYINKDGEQIVREEKYSVSKDNCKNAIDGDMVLVDIGSNGSKPRIEKVVDRTLGDITGVITRVGASFYVTPLDKKKQGLTIYLEGQHIEGEIVSVSIVDERDNNFYVAKIKEVFRHKDDPNEMARLEAFKCGMPEGFSEESENQLEYIPDVVSEEDKIGRYDFTEWEVFSIDGADTKDKDDCISYKKLPNGNTLLGVHIADVPKYVPTNSPIHKDAFRKGTSYYFGGCVEPQLPRKLSNGICSLNDGVERLCKTVLIEYDPEGNVVSRSLVPSVIKSRIGMTYDKVNDILKNGIVDEAYKPYENTLREMAKLAKKLRSDRVARGAINFNRPELKFIHDEKGKAIGVTHRYQDISENLIEEFMLAGNVNVFEILTEKGIPCPYRVHDVPNQERLTEFLKFLDVIGIPFNHSAEDICGNKHLFQLLTEHIKQGGVLYPMLCTNLIKCLSHAVYSPENIGHYGTGFDIYGHFTSPIRRLADDTVSRIIDDCYFEKDPIKRDRAIKKWKSVLPEFTTQASKMEKLEEEVEKQVNLLDTAVYMSNFIGQEFEGTVIAIGNNGLTIQLDNLLEGKVRLKNLPGEYVHNADKFTLLSLSGFSSYYVGDRLKLKLKETSIESKSVDFEVLEKIRENPIDNGEISLDKIKQKKRGSKHGRA